MLVRLNIALPETGELNERRSNDGSNFIQPPGYLNASGVTPAEQRNHS